MSVRVESIEALGSLVDVVAVTALCHRLIARLDAREELVAGSDVGGVSFNHVPGGGNVLYLDGHCEFLKYQKDGAFPVNGSFATLVSVIVNSFGSL